MADSREYVKLWLSYDDYFREYDDASVGALVRAMIAMAHSLGLSVVAEGIENERQRDYLTDLGCEHGQGYLFSRPVDRATTIARLTQAFRGSRS